MGRVSVLWPIDGRFRPDRRFNRRIGDPRDGLQKGFADARAAIEYVRSHAVELQVDPDRLCLAAYSAGGPLLAIGIGDPQSYIRCPVGFYGVLDIRPPITPERAAFSPVEQLKLHADKLPPIFIARAGKDSASLNAAIDRFVAEAASLDVAIEFHNIRGVPHAFDTQTPQPRGARGHRPRHRVYEGELGTVARRTVE